MEKKNKIELAITVALVAILAFFIISGGKEAAKKVQERRKKTLYSDVLTEKKDAGLPSLSKIAAESLRETGRTLYRRLEEEAEKIGLKRDPFSEMQISSADTTKSSGPLLSGIMWDKENPMAVINGNIVKIGDRVGNYFVVVIKQDKVILNDGTKDFELKLN